MRYISENFWRLSWNVCTLDQTSTAELKVSLQYIVIDLVMISIDVTINYRFMVMVMVMVMVMRMMKVMIELIMDPLCIWILP